MRYPNLRYGNPAEMAHYALWWGDNKRLAKALRRSERSVHDWLTGRKKVPWWVPEIMRLKRMEAEHTVYQITGRRMLAQLGIVQDGQIIAASQLFASEPTWSKNSTHSGPIVSTRANQA